MAKPITKKNVLLKTPALWLGLLIIILLIYLVGLPFYPLIKYQLYQIAGQNQNLAKENPISNFNQLFLAAAPRPDIANQPTGNRVIIPKIGVNAPIIESDNEQYALSRGAWLMPQTSTPDQGSNTVISAHRFKYLPPSNLTFYLLDKLAVGDFVNIWWQDQEYIYKVTETKIVPPTAIEILNPTEKPILTLFSCHPIWSEASRLVVVGELIK